MGNYEIDLNKTLEENTRIARGIFEKGLYRDEIDEGIKRVNEIREFQKGKTNCLLSAREKYGVSQKYVADIIGVSVNTLGKIERGESTPGVDLAYLLAVFYGKSVEELFFR